MRWFVIYVYRKWNNNETRDTSSCSTRRDIAASTMRHLYWISLPLLIALWVRIQPISGFGDDPPKPMLTFAAARPDLFYLNDIDKKLNSKAFQNSHNKFNFTKTYDVRKFGILHIINLKKYSPPSILNGIWNTLIKFNTSAMLFFQDDTTESRSVSEKYLLQMTSFLGLPIVTISNTIQVSQNRNKLVLVLIIFIF